MIPASIFIYLMNKAVKNFCVTNITKKVTNSQTHTRTPHTQTYTTGTQIKRVPYTIHNIIFWARLLRPMSTRWHRNVEMTIKAKRIHQVEAENVVHLSCSIIDFSYSIWWRGRGRRLCFCCCHCCYESLPSLSNEHFFANVKYWESRGKTYCERWWWC